MIKDLVEQLYPLNRQINSDGIDQALDIIGGHIPNWGVRRYAPGTECWTWEVPKRWKLHNATLGYTERDPCGFALPQRVKLDGPLSVVAYSQSVDLKLKWDELEPHLHYSEERPNAIPWVSSHYEDGWGFCIPKSVYDCLPKDATYRVVIDAEFTDDDMSVGVGGSADCFVMQANCPPETTWGDFTKHKMYDTWPPKPELLLCAHVCHPMQANDDISGVAVLCDVARRLQENPLPDDALGVRFLFCPETIGSTAYLSQNEWLIPHIKAGIFVEMAGTDGPIELQRSWPGKGRIDRIAAVGIWPEAIARLKAPPPFFGRDFGTIRCNDEKVINGPGVDIPCVSLMRWPYPEYHTSDDNPDIIHEDKLQEMADVVERIVRIYCTDYIPKRTFRGYLNTRKYGIRVDWTKDWDWQVASQNILHLLEGDLSVFEISERVGLDYWQVREYIETLREKGLVIC